MQGHNFYITSCERRRNVMLWRYIDVNATLYKRHVPAREYTHYENTPIQINRIFHLQKLKIFR